MDTVDYTRIETEQKSTNQHGDIDSGFRAAMPRQLWDKAIRIEQAEADKLLITACRVFARPGTDLSLLQIWQRRRCRTRSAAHCAISGIRSKTDEPRLSRRRARG